MITLTIIKLIMTRPKPKKDLLPKGPPPTFKGGSKIKSYRVPKDPKLFAECDKAIKLIISKYKVLQLILLISLTAGCRDAPEPPRQYTVSVPGTGTPYLRITSNGRGLACLDSTAAIIKIVPIQEVYKIFNDLALRCLAAGKTDSAKYYRSVSSRLIEFTR